MTKKEIGYDTLKGCSPFLGYKETERIGVMTLKDGSKVTTHFYEFKTPEGPIMVNLSKTKVTLEFKDEQELKAYYNDKVEMYESDKELATGFLGMTEETWEEWNK